MMYRDKAQKSDVRSEIEEPLGLKFVDIESMLYLVLVSVLINGYCGDCSSSFVDNCSSHFHSQTISRHSSIASQAQFLT